MEIILPYIIQLAAGAAGGIAAGIVFKSLSLGPVGNALAGVAGAGISGQMVLMRGGGGLLEGVA
ncbi:MAG: hypothetical protein HKN15_05185, partial [Xanthomonadales bacterium]|nr:hypothetical protein [Xanthomonadales bacterium]